MQQAGKISQGIHPRVSNGRTVHDKVNTMRGPNKEVTRRKIAAITAHLDLHPRDGHSQSHLSALKGRL